MVKVCHQPLPDSELTAETAATATRSWVEFSELIQSPGWQRGMGILRRRRRYELQRMLHLTPAEIDTARAQAAALAAVERLVEERAELAEDAAEPDRVAPEQPLLLAFEDEADASAAIDAANEVAAMTKLRGWAWFEGFAAARAWAYADALRHCPAADQKFYAHAMSNVRHFFETFQDVIDRGDAAAAWLKDKAEEATRKEQRHGG